MRKVFKFVTTILILLLSLSLTSCKDNNNLEVNYVVDIKKTESVGLKDIYTIYYKDGSTEKFEITNGANGQDGKPGIDGKPGENGQDGMPGINGVDGKPGIDGKTPHIGENGNWFIGDYDTGISATGPQGKPGQNGVDGKPGENGQDGKPGENAPHYGETFKVTYHLNGGTFNEETNMEAIVNWGDTINLPIPYKYGYAFEGWYTGNTVNDKKFTNYDAVFRDVDLFAKFVPAKYKLTLDLNGGSTSSPTEYFFIYGSRYQLPTDVFKLGYDFVNWTLNGKEFPVTGIYNYENITLVANFKKKDNLLTVAQAIAKAKEIGDTTNPIERFMVLGKVKKVINHQYGEMTIYDETGELSLYNTYSYDGSLRYPEMSDKPYKGDELVVSTTLSIFKGKAQGKSAWIQSFKHVTVEDDKTYTKMSIKEAREAKVDAAVEVTGIVAFKTLGQKKAENGFYLVDAYDSIYISDDQIAPRVKVGNKVTLKGTKEMFIIDKEVANANKFGYTGSCQISNVTLVENDNKENKVDLSFAEEITIKNLINKPLDENYRTKIYKTNAYLNKVPGKGFTNYYINDLDNETGSYVYTSNNGNDFAYLDKFDGKICTVYISVINMRVSATGCIARFIPILVEDNNYKFDLTTSNEFVVEYALKDQFEETYNTPYAFDLVDKYENTSLGIKDVNIKYESLTPDFAKILNAEGKTRVQIKNEKAGEAQIKVTVTSSGDTEAYSHIFKINVEKTPKLNALGVKAASTKVDQEVYITGIAGPSLINQAGFYIIDETGALAVKLGDASQMSKIKFGEKVTVKGKVTDYSNKPGEATKFSRVLLDSSLELNFGGNHKYSDASFIKDKTATEVLGNAANVTTEDTTKVYRMEVKIEVEEAKHYTNYYVTDVNGNYRTLIYNNANQNGFLAEFKDKVVTVEFAFCNYNNKKDYFGSILSVTDGAKKVYNLYNYQK